MLSGKSAYIGYAHGSRTAHPILKESNMVRVVTLQYEATHGHKSRQPRGHATWPWAFQIDLHPTPVIITASYKDALRKAKSQAKFCVTVWP